MDTSYKRCPAPWRAIKQGPERDRREGFSPSAQAAQADRGGSLHPLRDAKAASAGEAEPSRSGLSCPCWRAMLGILFGVALMKRKCCMGVALCHLP